MIRNCFTSLPDPRPVQPRDHTEHDGSRQIALLSRNFESGINCDRTSHAT